MSKEFAIIEHESLKTQTNDSVVNLALQTLEMNKQVLVFNNSKRSSEATAEKIANALTQSAPELKILSEKLLKVLSSPTKQCKRLAKCVEKGIAFHHSGLVGKQRTLLEDAFKKGIIKLISSTPTLAAGLNLPAYKVIIKDYKRYSQRGFQDIPILEFHQMAGRAGRPGHETTGKAVVCVKSQDELDRVVPKYVFGKPEEIMSKLAVEPTLKMYMLSLVSMDMINTKEEIKTFFKNTFYAHQFQDLKALEYNLFKILEVLKDYDFISQDDDYYTATALGKKVSELYLNPDTAAYFLDHLDKFITMFSKKNITRFDIYSFLFFVVNSTEMKPLFRVPKTQEEIYMQKVEEIGDDLVVGFDPFEMDLMNYLSLVKTSDVFEDWIHEAHEDFISEKYSITPGELNYKLDTLDWLLYCLEEFSLMKKSFFMKNQIQKLRQRCKYGVKADIIPLLSLKGVGRVRARKLAKLGVHSLIELKQISFEKLEKELGTKIAISLKEQVQEGDVMYHREKLTQEKPHEIKVREVSDEEVDLLVDNEVVFEKEKQEKNKSLTSFF